MNRLLYIPVAVVVAIIQSLPLTLVALLGRMVGHLGWWLDWKHRRIAVVSLDIAFGGQITRDERARIARENFCRLGEAFFCALKTTVMRREDLGSRLQLVGVNKVQPWLDDAAVPGIVVATGHFGNFEIYGEAARTLAWVQPLAVFRETRFPILNRILANVRAASPVRFFNERNELDSLRETIRGGNVVLGLMADYNPGLKGLQVPFFGKPAATEVAPLVQAYRFRMPFFCAVCFRTGLGRWRVELSDRIETRVNGRPRPAVDVLGEMNDYFEVSIRRDPANWCWAHERWGHEGRKADKKDKSSYER